jgi:hypothetical protein
MSGVAVVIPVYKADPSESELMSFQQCLSVLGKHPIVLIIPQGLDTSRYLQDSKDDITIQKLSFAPSFFSSIKGYSQLLLSRQFYNALKQYEYILIYQLDAWVFKDELSKWCALNMDYIGAPWLSIPPITSGKKPIINLSNMLKNKVGNGGFSLRKTDTHLRWSWWATFIFSLLPKNEDIIWSIFVPLKKPDCLTALNFAFEMEPEKSIELTNGKLPFGCHAWEKYNPQFWTPYIPFE